MTPKLELVIRKIHNNLIITGVMVTDSFKAGDFMGFKLIGNKLDENTIAVFIDKQEIEIRDPYNRQFKDSSLTELPMNDIWQKFKSPEPNEFGGVAIGRDNLLFADESPEQVSRTAIISVIDLNELTFDFEHHCAFRSVKVEEVEDMYVFILKKDTSDDTLELLGTLMGDSLNSFYSKPFWTRDNGEKYRLKTVNHREIDALYKLQISELGQFGELTKETEEAITAKSRWLKLNKDESYRAFLSDMMKRCPFYLDAFDRILTPEESKLIDEHAKAIIEEMHG
ncbi:hypothetical protein B9J93_19305 [Vibrio sp. V17_P4S1T151]|uniref:hypothetical protein n=1 Tax=unclassified Vibrio TaxID=2614977 RepID=UPI000B8EDA5A|nr:MULTISPECIES: hypothetical protein [unclassified Vibrio]OXX41797.1 hypothetical protein B9J93_19305 [Vibrio sp. V17_P4S1T151]OXX65109.1 hypothetical protein B9J89_04280 [Vibrio sp. V15_P4S5T153]